MLRSRGKVVSWKTIKDFDAFPKVSDTYIEPSPVGGTLTLIAWIAITWIIYWEVTFYLDARFKFRFLPDTEFDAKLKVNVDITVAMPCANLGADILDSTNQNILQFGILEEEDTWFELSPQQRLHFDSIQQVNSNLREESHALQDVLWRSTYLSLFGDMPPREEIPDHPPDACRFHGTLMLNKVAGNFHITAGKTLNLAQGHFHLSAIAFGHTVQNFSHRIERFSFGDPSPGIIHPLEGDEKIADNSAMLYQYFLEVVGTEVSTMRVPRMSTYQYSARAHERPVDHARGSHGIPGIYFKYDMAAMRVKITQERDSSLLTFLARLCAIVGGVYVCVGMLNSAVLYISSLIEKKPSPGYSPLETSPINANSEGVKPGGEPIPLPFPAPSIADAAVSLDGPPLPSK
ncbi:endoplasmic reticulum-Golgi intermediate compartment protein 2 [Ischnura elegans]|uniref:endoplasmic reticulum-Golgi intermediate compartment protein 2 n=1 Tax=Ischnura elegans TaxID=197161 RepID=UPI001ED87237|nr:endoplasmic reticulum-Golgi intermediate compartment protein 2 [Ischnura elegans]